MWPKTSELCLSYKLMGCDNVGKFLLYDMWSSNLLKPVQTNAFFDHYFIVRIVLKSTVNTTALVSIQLLLGIFFSTRSVALIEDIPGDMGEIKGYSSSARFGNHVDSFRDVIV